MTMLLTEALAEHKLILKKIDDKNRQIQHYATRLDSIVDPLLKSGSTSDKFVAEALQSIEDLSKRAILIKSAISAKNREVKVSFGLEMTVEDAIQWKRDIAPRVIQVYQMLLGKARTDRQLLDKSTQLNKDIKLLVNFDEKDVMESLTAVEDMLAKLDMKLSIVNATQYITV